MFGKRQNWPKLGKIGYFWSKNEIYPRKSLLVSIVYRRHSIHDMIKFEAGFDPPYGISTIDILKCTQAQLSNATKFML